MLESARSSVISRKGLLILALLYSLFLIYGSLVPLDFHPLSLEQAWSRFANILHQDLSFDSWTDWTANSLLAIPLACLWQGAVWPRRNVLLRLLSTLVIWILCLILSTGVEFMQLFFPSRVTAKEDIVAQSIGAMLGIVVWWWQGPSLWAWVLEWKSARGPVQLAEKLLWAYFAVLLGYSVLPLDLTISPVEIYHHWYEGGVRLNPFTISVSDPVQLIYDLGTDVILWIPVSALWVLSGRKGSLQAWRWTVLAATSIEVMHVFICSRISATRHILTAMLGAALGIWLASPWRRIVPQTAPRRSLNPLAWGIAGFFLWSLMLAAVYWYPFDFRLDAEYLRKRLDLLFTVPLYAYWSSSELRAATELLHKVVFFIPLGLALALARLKLRGTSFRGLFDVMAISALALVALAIELGRIAQPNKFPDSIDWVLGTLGGVIGYLGAFFIIKRLSVPPSRLQSAQPRRPPANTAAHPVNYSRSTVPHQRAGRAIKRRY